MHSSSYKRCSFFFYFIFVLSPSHPFDVDGSLVTQSTETRPPSAALSFKKLRANIIKNAFFFSLAEY